MRRLLIIRSASFQQLDKNLASIRARFPAHEIHLLTHEHGRRLAEKYAVVDRVLIYPKEGPFSAVGGSTGLTQGNYEDLVVLVSNLSGAGFTNVFEFAAALPGDHIHQCNLVGEIREIPRDAIRSLRRRDLVRNIFAWTLGNALGIAASLAFSLGLLLLRLLQPKDLEWPR